MPSPAFISTVQHADGARSLGATSEHANLPVTNLLDDQIHKVWRTEDGDTAVSLLVTFDGLRYVDGVALINCNFSDAALIRVRASTTSATMASGVVYDSGAAPAHVDPRYAIATHILPVSVQCLYVLIDLVDPKPFVTDATLYLEAGRLWVGQIWRFIHKHKAGHKEDYIDYSKQDPADSGHIWVYRNATARRWSLTLPALTEAEYDAHGSEIGYNIGSHTCVLLCLDSNVLAIGRKTLWGLLTGNVTTFQSIASTPNRTPGDTSDVAYYTWSLVCLEQN